MTGEHVPSTQKPSQSVSAVQLFAAQLPCTQPKFAVQSAGPAHVEGTQRCVGSHVRLGPQSALLAQPLLHVAGGIAPPCWQAQGDAQMDSAPASWQSPSV
jgi:hypothetical protein